MVIKTLDSEPDQEPVNLFRMRIRIGVKCWFRIWFRIRIENNADSQH